ncbi:hypothetical protein Hanom_Chr08g00751201 [Helianthus anomalus]
MIKNDPSILSPRDDLYGRIMSLYCLPYQKCRYLSSRAHSYTQRYVLQKKKKNSRHPIALKRCTAYEAYTL